MTKTEVEVIGRQSRLSAYVLYVAIAGAPLPFGSRDPIIVAFWCLLLGSGLIFASTRILSRGHFLVLCGIGFVTACYGFVLHEQVAAKPWIASYNTIWVEASRVLGKPLKPAVSIVRDEPLYALGPPLSAMLALTLGLLVGADRERARQAVTVLAWAGVCYATYGIWSFLFEPNTILWLEKTAYVGSLTGTFINRNTAATYFGSCAIVWLVLLFESVRGRLPREAFTWLIAIKYLTTDTPRELALRFVLFFVCLATLFLTNSRGGVLLSLFTFVTAFMLYFRRDLPRGKALIGAAAMATIVALVLLQFLGANVGHRIDIGGISDQGRLEAYRSTLRMIADNPWFGTGLGTFASAFPAYRSSQISMWGVWDAAHSTPLELAEEVGLPLTLIIAASWAIMLIILAGALRGSRRDIVIPLTALSVSLLALLHSTIDFSLQVSGYAIVVFALLGVGIGHTLAIDTGSKTRIRRGHSRSRATNDLKS